MGDMNMGKRFFSAIREPVRREIESLGEARIVVGIPSFFSEESITNVIRMVEEGLYTHYRDHHALILISDGGSTDDTREAAETIPEQGFSTRKIVSVYRGLPGKGSALRAVFEVARYLNAEAVAVIDSDLRSITPGWIRSLLDPIFNGFDYVTPDYTRFKYDGTITNTIAYMLIRSLYGVKLRQPIGGDFGISRRLVRRYLEHDVWESDIARFGVDIWMTTTAVVDGFRICQTRLGAKVHGAKDPGTDLSPMFRQVVGTIFRLMKPHEEFWKGVSDSANIPTFGDFSGQTAEPFEIDRQALMDYFRVGFQNFRGVWESVLSPVDIKLVESLAADGKAVPDLPIENWARIVYDYACAFHATPFQKFKLLDTMVPLYYARVASLVRSLENESVETAEIRFDEHAGVFEKMKPYLVEKWGRAGGEPWPTFSKMAS